jgi:nucleotide-binding universal stress UspA family protein
MERERIVVGVDGSPGSQAALRWALDEARRHGADVEAVYCWAPSYSAMASGDAHAYLTEDEVSAEGKAHLEKAMAACAREIDASRGAGVVVSTQILESDVRGGLIAESKEAAMLVVGRRGHGGLSRLVLGSVSRQVATHAHCPVVVIPEAD